MSSSDQSEKNANSELSSPFPIVGIGASAGGLEALEHFFPTFLKTVESLILF
ncbi:MAG: hypothetical protein ABEI32_11085 [Halothece sp.]